MPFFFQDKDGRVRRKEFRKILDSFPFRISDEQFKQLMYRVDPEGKGYVSYHGFLKTFEVKEGKVNNWALFFSIVLYGNS